MEPNKLLVINSSKAEDTQFTDPLLNIIEEFKIPYSVRHWSAFTNVTSVENYTGVIISASPRGNNENFYQRLKAFYWLKKYENPVFGICAGHQLTGVIYGANLLTGVEAEEGKVTIEILRKDPVFKEFSDTLTGEQHHNDSITLPPDFILLASSKKCKVEAIRHKNKPIYTFQWHAEISNPDLVRNFIEIMKNFQSNMR